MIKYRIYKCIAIEPYGKGIGGPSFQGTFVCSDKGIRKNKTIQRIADGYASKDSGQPVCEGSRLVIGNLYRFRPIRSPNAHHGMPDGPYEI